MGGIVLSWQSFLHLKSLYVPSTLPPQERIYPHFSKLSLHVSQILPFLSNVLYLVYNDCPPEIAQIWQIVEDAAASKNLLSDAGSKEKPETSEGQFVMSVCVAKCHKVCVENYKNNKLLEKNHQS